MITKTQNKTEKEKIKDIENKNKNQYLRNTTQTERQQINNALSKAREKKGLKWLLDSGIIKKESYIKNWKEV